MKVAFVLCVILRVCFQEQIHRPVFHVRSCKQSRAQTGKEQFSFGLVWCGEDGHEYDVKKKIIFSSMQMDTRT
jgi:hypothetical protein